MVKLDIAVLNHFWTLWSTVKCSRQNTSRQGPCDIEAMVLCSKSTQLRPRRPAPSKS